MAGLIVALWIPAFAGMTGDAGGEEDARASSLAAAALARGVTLTLALSHEGRGDPPAGRDAWFRAANH